MVNGNDVEKISERWNISGRVNPDMEEVASVLESTEIMEDAKKYLRECRDRGRCPYCKRKKY